MDTLTHGLAGALVAKALPGTGDEGLDRRLGRREAFAGLLAAMLPDADALPNIFSAEFYIEHHRHLTHSFVLLPVWAIGLALLFSMGLPVPPGEAGRAARRVAQGRLVLVSGLGLASHILLDWVTSWGTRFLAPLSERAFSLDWLFIVDFFLAGLLLLGLAAAFLVFRRHGRLAARIALASASLYVGFCGLMHGRALSVAGKLAPGAGIHAAIPQPFLPTRWLLLSETGQHVRADFVDFLARTPAGPPAAREALDDFHASRESLLPTLKRLDAFYRPPEDPAPFFLEGDGRFAARGLADAEASVFGRFARFPVAHAAARRGGSVVVTVRDARFAHLADGLDPFAYVLQYSPDGRLSDSGFPSSRWLKPSGSHGLGLTR
ncbi:MAG: metal-dependent hydrolase [Thermoanaerobaculia bacterium]